MAGWHAGQNRIAGGPLLGPSGERLTVGDNPTIAKNNQRFGMLSTDEGMVAIGIHHGNREFLECALPDKLQYYYYFSFANDQFANMSSVRAGDGIVGIQKDNNVLTAVTTRVPPDMEGEPANPTIVNVYLDLMRCDTSYNSKNFIDTPDKFTVVAGGHSISGVHGNMVDWYEFHSNEAKGRGPFKPYFITRLGGKDGGNSLKLGTLSLAAGQLQSMDISLRELNSGIAGMVSLSVQLKDGRLASDWKSRGFRTQVDVLKVLEQRQARVYMHSGDGNYWLHFRLEPR